MLNMKQLVQRRDGISFIVREAVAAEIREGKLESRPIKGERLLLDVSIAYVREQCLSRPAKAFLDCLLKIAPKENKELTRIVLRGDPCNLIDLKVEEGLRLRSFR